MRPQPTQLDRRGGPKFPRGLTAARGIDLQPAHGPQLKGNEQCAAESHARSELPTIASLSGSATPPKPARIATVTPRSASITACRNRPARLPIRAVHLLN